jgi:hypothetical protein
MPYFINDWTVRDGFIPPLLLLMGMSRLCRYRHGFADDFWKVSTKIEPELQNSPVLTPVM